MTEEELSATMTRLSTAVTEAATPLTPLLSGPATNVIRAQSNPQADKIAAGHG